LLIVSITITLIVSSLFERLLLQILQSALGDGLARVALRGCFLLEAASSLLPTLVPHARVHNTAFATLSCPHHRARILASSTTLLLALVIIV